MSHIHQKNITAGRGEDQPIYTVVRPDGFENNLSQHPAILEHPELFEITDEEIPTERPIQFLKYEND